MRSRTASKAQLQKSFAGAEEIAEQHPQYADAITAGAKGSFLDGADWAYTAGIAAILLGFVFVFFLFPKKDEAQRLLARYQAEDVGSEPAPKTTRVEA
jgi:MFS transporter, DHA2 family, multidrug resistance protein